MALSAAVVLAGGRTWVDGQVDADTAGPPLEAGRELSQTLRAPAEGLVAVDLLLASYAARADGTLEVVLVDGSGARLSAWRLAAGRVVDNAWHRFRLDEPLTGIAGERLTLVARRNEAGGRPVTMWTTGGDAYPIGRLAVDGMPAGGDLTFRAIYRPGWRGGAELMLASTGFPPAVGVGLLFGLVASALGAVWAMWMPAAGGNSNRLWP